MKDRDLEVIDKSISMEGIYHVNEDLQQEHCFWVGFYQFNDLSVCELQNYLESAVSADNHTYQLSILFAWLYARL